MPRHLAASVIARISQWTHVQLFYTDLCKLGIGSKPPILAYDNPGWCFLMTWSLYVLYRFARLKLGNQILLRECITFLQSQSTCANLSRNRSLSWEGKVPGTGLATVPCMVLAASWLGHCVLPTVLVFDVGRSLLSSRVHDHPLHFKSQGSQ